MRMKYGCEPSWSQLDLEGNEKPYCLTHNTYEVTDESGDNDTYDDFPILSDKEYEILNQKYISVGV